MAWASRSQSVNLFSWWGVLSISIGAGLLVGLFVALFWPSTYSATATFFVSDPAALLATLQAPANVPEEAVLSSLKPSPERLGAILSSRLLRARLVQKHHLDQRFGMEPTFAEELLARMAKITPIGSEGFSITVTCKGYTDLRVRISHALTRQEARQLCAALANDYLAELQQYITTTSIQEARKRREFIQNAQRQALQELQKAERGMQQLQQAYACLDFETEASLLTDRIRVLEQAEAEAKAKLAETQKSLAKTRGQLGRMEAMRVASVVKMRHPLINSLEQKIADLQAELATAEAQGKTRQNRDVIQILAALEANQRQLAQLKQEVIKEMAQQVNPLYEKLATQAADLEVTLAGAQARVARTTALLHSARQKLASLPPVARRYAALKQDHDIQFQTLAALKQSMAVALVQEQQSKRVGEFLVLDKAVPPPDLYGPPVLLSMFATTLLILAIMGLLALNRLIFGA